MSKYVDDLIRRSHTKDALISALREENAQLRAQVAELLIEHQALLKELAGQTDTGWTADPYRLAALREGL